MVIGIAAAQQTESRLLGCVAATTNQSFVKRVWCKVKKLSVRTIVLSAFLAALWLFGLVGQAYSAEAALRYLVLSMALVAIALWRMEPRPALLRRRVRDRRPPE